MNTEALEFKIDASSEAEIRQHLICCNRQFIPPLSERTDIPAYAAKIREHALTFEVWDQRRLIGLVAAYLTPEKRSCFITNVSVEAGFAGQGLGSRMVQAFLGHLLVLNVVGALLEVSASCQPAIRLYQKLGFRPVECHGGIVRMQWPPPG